jgi:hypothetical protein
MTAPTLHRAGSHCQVTMADTAGHPTFVTGDGEGSARGLWSGCPARFAAMFILDGSFVVRSSYDGS